MASAASAARADPSLRRPRRGLLTLDISLLSSDWSGEVQVHWWVETCSPTDGCLPPAGEEPVDGHRRDHDEPADDGDEVNGDAGDDEAVLDHLDQQQPEHRREHGPGAAR